MPPFPAKTTGRGLATLAFWSHIWPPLRSLLAAAHDRFRPVISARTISMYGHIRIQPVLQMVNFGEGTRPQVSLNIYDDACTGLVFSGTAKKS
jgi:hypothetical protein